MKAEIGKGTTVGCYRLIEKIGIGQHSEVWMAQDVSHEEFVALKLTSEQCKISTIVEHPNILCPKEQFSFEQKHAIVFPLCVGRSVKSIGGEVGEFALWNMLRDISAALAVIHSKGSAHGSIRPSHILYTGKEFVITQPKAMSYYKITDDIWDVGATIFFMCMGCHVFQGHGRKAQKKDSPLPYMRKSMPELSEIVRNCLDINVKQRPTAEWLFAISNDKLLNWVPRKREFRRTERHNINIATDFWPDEMRRL